MIIDWFTPPTAGALPSLRLKQSGQKGMALYVKVTLTRADGSKEELDTRCRIDTGNELTYYRNDGILHYVIRNMLD